MLSTTEFRNNYILIATTCLITMILSLIGGYPVIWEFSVKYGFDYKTFHDACIIFSHTALMLILTLAAIIAVRKYRYSNKHYLIAATGILLFIINTLAFFFYHLPYR